MLGKSKKVVLVGTLLSVWVGAVVGSDAGDATHGKRLYVEVGCFECHGRLGEGGVFNGPAPALAEIQAGLSYAAFAAMVRAGPNDMPAYSAKSLPDRDLADIYAYIRTLRGPTDPSKVPLLLR